MSLERGPRVGVVRGLLFASAALAFLGLAGVPLGDMRARNLGIVGYAVVFPIAAGLHASHQNRWRPPGTLSPGTS